MGRQGSAIDSTAPPAAALQSAPAMPPLPPRPPKKRYLLENPPRPTAGLLQLAEVSSPPVSGPPLPISSSLNSRPPARPLPEEMPLNLTTAATTEVRLSRIVDRVVEKMLKKGGMDDGKSGDPLRLWFTNQFETRQRNESGSTPSPGQKSASPQLPSPAAVGSPDQPSPAQLETSEDQTELTELRIGMSDTINRVIDNVYRSEVSSCSSDSVSTTGLSPRTGRRAHKLQRPRRPAALQTAPAKHCRPADHRVPMCDDGRLPPPLSDAPLSAAVYDGADVTYQAADTPDSRSGDAALGLADQSLAAAFPGQSPQRRPRPRKRTIPPADPRQGEIPTDEAAGRHNRKRKVGKEDIVRIQHMQAGPPSATVVSPANERSKSQSK